MRSCLSVLIACLVPVAGWAQDGLAQEVQATAASQREQRRAELRTALQGHRQVVVGDPAEAAVSPTRHLSVQERAEMRRQLRQQGTVRRQAGN